MKAHAGFIADSGEPVALPRSFFSEVLPLIDSLEELKVTLHLFCLRGRMDAGRPGALMSELLADDRLLLGLESADRSGSAALRLGLELAVARGTLLHVTLRRGADTEEWYFVNDAEGRTIADRLRAGDLSDLPRMAGRDPAHVQVERPNVFVLYEQNIGSLTPLIAEELRYAERTYPADWIEDAFRIAVEQNVRRWRYVRAILDRWSLEGRDDVAAAPSDRDDGYRYIRGKYGEFIEH
jgi:DNA replication protein